MILKNRLLYTDKSDQDQSLDGERGVPRPHEESGGAAHRPFRSPYQTLFTQQ